MFHVDFLNKSKRKQTNFYALLVANNINNILKILINIEQNMRRINSLIINSSNFAGRQESINFELQKKGKKDEQKSSAEAAAGEQIVLHNGASSMGLGLVDLLEWGWGCCCCW